MSMRCSVLGHETVEEEKEVESEDGVSVTKTVERCQRCGAEETVHEKKRVSIAEAESEFHDDLGPDAANTPAAGAQPTVADGGHDSDDDEPLAEYSTDDIADDEIEAKGDAVFIDDGPDEPADTANTADDANQSAASPATSSDPRPDPATQPTDNDDDAMLIGDDADPAEPQQSATDAHTTNSAASTDDSFSASTPETESAGADEQGGGEILTPGDDAETTPGSSSASTTSSSTSTSTSPSRTGDVDGDLTCDTCRFSESSEGTPIRVGDICPNCKQGYIERAE